ncbi:MAG: hypothetical protein IKA52_04110 [Bacteroidaceae bacterium]|nr:hypothetical protein [Bacteroidaceae bacterium]
MLCACDGTLFHSFRSLNGGWQRGNNLVYMYDGRYMSAGVYGMYLEARTIAGYRYKNLTVRAEYYNMRDSLLAVDTIPLVIYNENGSRAGATAGMLYQQSSDMRLVNLPAGDSVVISLSHLMPDETLKGVTDVGVRLVGLH